MTQNLREAEKRLKEAEYKAGKKLKEIEDEILAKAARIRKQKEKERKRQEKEARGGSKLSKWFTKADRKTVDEPILEEKRIEPKIEKKSEKKEEFDIIKILNPEFYERQAERERELQQIQQDREAERLRENQQHRLEQEKAKMQKRLEVRQERHQKRISFWNRVKPALKKAAVVVGAVFGAGATGYVVTDLGASYKKKQRCRKK